MSDVTLLVIIFVTFVLLYFVLKILIFLLKKQFELMVRFWWVFALILGTLTGIVVLGDIIF